MPAETWLLTGATGQLGGWALHELCHDPARPRVFALARQPAERAGATVVACDLAQLDTLRPLVTDLRPTHALHLGAVTSVADAFADPARAQRVNADATAELAAAVRACGARFVYASTDMVFDGDHAPYAEGDEPRPLSVYGRTKLAGERALAGSPHALTVRIPLMYGLPRHPRRTTFAQQLDALHAATPLRLFHDEFRTPVWLRDAARALIGLARSDLAGVIHLAGPQRLSRLDLIARAATLLGLPTSGLTAVSRLSVGGDEPRPADLSLDGARLAQVMPALTPGPLRIDALR
ncbi:MAG: hypothetical protein CHACPFDD_03009 [Phycisphaerae bacterium]|nr:hypothetical protein [Phycisphaerae bacterium]